MRLIDADALDERKFIGVATWPATTDVTSWQRGWNDAIETIMEAQPSVDAVPVVRCKDCKHFEYDHPYIIQGIPIFAHELCNAWGDGCKTNENGYCFMAERKDDERSD